MNPAPLILRGYFVEQLSFSANSAFQPEKPTLLDLSDIKVESAIHEFDLEGEPLWQINLQVVQNVPEEKNSPYNFAVVLIGHFQVANQYPAAKRRRLLETNGCSLLYGTCREIIRAATAQGPHQPILLPTLSFYEPKPGSDAAHEEPKDSPRVAEDPS